MAQPKKSLTDVRSNAVTRTTQSKSAANLRMNLLRILASDALQDAKDRQAERRAWVQSAVASFRRLTRREGSNLLASAWQMAPDGVQAIRVLRQIADLRRQDALASLGRQIQMTTLNHPGLAPLIEMAFYEAYPYVITRLRAGVHPLSQEVGQPMELKRAFRLAGQVSDALQYLHYRGLFHGALSPDDIFVDQTGNPLVAGVGLEQVRRLLQVTERPTPTALTPPEVAQGGAPDARSDVYAVAALIHLLLTGRPPVPGRPTHVTHQHPAIPPTLDEILTKALAINPDDRYQSLVDMNRALRPTIYSLRPVAGRPTPKATPAPKPDTTPERTAPARERRLPTPPRAELAGLPEPIPFPEIDLGVLAEGLVLPELEVMQTVAIPPAPPIPEVDWETLLQPIDLIDLLPTQAAPTATPSASVASSAAPAADAAPGIAVVPPTSPPAQKPPTSRPRRATRS